MVDQTTKVLEDNRRFMIIDAALSTFALKGYRKASIQDIASQAQVSKALVLYHFPTKHQLLLDLLSYCSTLIAHEIKLDDLLQITDFFERIKVVTLKKVQLLKSHRALFLFLNRMIHEEDTAIQSEIRQFRMDNQSHSQDFALKSIDTSRFKPLINPEQVFRLVSYFSEGFLAQNTLIDATTVDCIMEEFIQHLNLLRTSFYQEEPL